MPKMVSLKPATWRVTVRRENGRFVKEFTGLSKYKSKRLANNLSTNVYDHTYLIVREEELEK